MRANTAGAAILLLGTSIGTLVPILAFGEISREAFPRALLVVACLTGCAVGLSSWLAVRALVLRRFGLAVEESEWTAQLRHRLGAGQREPNEAGKTILQTLLDLCRSRAGILYAYSSGSVEELVTIGIGNGGSGGATPVGQDAGVAAQQRGAAAIALANNGVTVLTPQRDREAWDRLHPPFMNRQPRSLVVIPLSRGAEIVGVAIVAGSARGLDRGRRTILESVRRRAALALENAILRRKLRYLVAIDEETGLLNRRAGTLRLKQLVAFANRFSLPVGTALFELAGLDEVRAAHGPLAADAAVRRAASVIEHGVRAGDVTWRHDRGTFGIAVVSVTLPELTAIVERLKGDVLTAATAEAAAETTHGPGSFEGLSVVCGLAAWDSPDRVIAGDTLVSLEEALERARWRNRSVVAIRGEGEAPPQDASATRRDAA